MQPKTMLKILKRLPVETLSNAEKQFVDSGIEIISSNDKSLSVKRQIILSDIIKKCHVSERFLVIDDLRIFDNVTSYARTFEDGISELKNNGPWDILYLDHDLGSVDDEKTGYGILLFLEQNKNLLPEEIILVSANPVGVKRMKQILEKIYQ